MITVIWIIILILLFWILYWIGGLYYTIRKGMNEIIKGLATIDERLQRIENIKSKK
ncbi:MAG: hypothetical protein JSV88_26350 [Candidatus Aminicenantes bacterium]|nr:MAG: hypothetical protein JSV88_26350 [Candidatus Aminicenantes bacterium]